MFDEFVQWLKTFWEILTFSGSLGICGEQNIPGN